MQALEDARSGMVAARRAQMQTHIEQFVPNVSALPAAQYVDQSWDSVAAELPVRCPVARRAPDSH